MRDELVFIDLGRIGVVEKMVYEMEGRYYWGDLKSRWSTRVGMRVPQTFPFRTFVIILFFLLKLENFSFTMYT